MLLLGHWPALVGADARLFELRPVAGIDGSSLMGHRVGSCAFSPITLVDSAIPIISVLQMPEHLLRRAVVQAVAFARHALDEPGVLEPLDPLGVLVLPAHVRVQHGLCPLRLLGHQRVEKLGLLSHVGASRRRPRDDLLAAEVVDRREVRLAPGLLELGDVGAHLLPRRGGLEVPPDDVLEGVADLALVRAVFTAAGLAPDPAAQAHLAHHLEHRLVGDDRALLGAQAHRYLAMPAAVGGAREYLGRGVPKLGPRGALGVR